MLGIALNAEDIRYGYECYIAGCSESGIRIDLHELNSRYCNPVIADKS